MPKDKNPNWQIKDALAGAQAMKHVSLKRLTLVLKRLDKKINKMRADGDPYTEIKKIMNQRDAVAEHRDMMKFGLPR